MRIVLIGLIIIHSLIHLLGFAKAFKIAKVPELHQPISKVKGSLWLLASIAFGLAALLFGLEKDWWWMFSISGLVISQFLVVNDWHDARFGTIANVIILVITVIGFVIWCITKY